MGLAFVLDCSPFHKIILLQVDFPNHLWYKNMLSLQIASSISLNLVAIFAGVAQLAEQLICNQQVAGSSPIASSNISEKIVF